MIVLNVTYKCRPGMREEFLERIMTEGIDAASRGEEGNLKYDYYLPFDGGDELLLVEKWRDGEALKTHAAAPHFKRLGEIKSEYVLETAIERYADNGQAEKDFLELAKSRYSVRRFSDKPIEGEKLELILRAGQAAPTACNYQPHRVYVLKSPEALEKLQKCKTSRFGETLALLVCCDTGECWKRDYDGKPSGDIDAAIVATHMMLEAWELGIGSTWVMHFMPEAVRAEFCLPENEEPAALLVMGYPAEDAHPSRLHAQNKPLEETVKFL